MREMSLRLLACVRPDPARESSAAAGERERRRPSLRRAHAHLRMELLEPLHQRGLVVVLALGERLASDVVLAVNLWRLRGRGTRRGIDALGLAAAQLAAGTALRLGEGMAMRTANFSW